MMTRTARAMLGRFGADTRANMATVMALVFPLGLFAAAFAIDEAALYHQKRQLQGAVDMAAIYAAGDPANATARARAALIDSGHAHQSDSLAALTRPEGPLVVETGRYRPDSDLATGERFAAGATPADAVRVRFDEKGRLFFARAILDAPPPIRASAVASATPEAGFAIGSRLVSLNGGVANAVLGALLGTELSLSVMDYNALAGLDLKLLDFLEALSAQATLHAGTYGEVLDARVRLADIALALAAAAVDSGGNPAAVDLLVRVAGLIDDGIYVEMLDVLAVDGLAQLALGTPVAGLEAHLDALELLSVSALLADTERQISLGLGAGIPGLAGIGAQLAVGERPQSSWYAIGKQGTFVRTAQTRLRLDLSVVGHGGTGIGLLEIGLPVYAELAPAEAELAALYCPPGNPQAGRATIAARPGVLRLAIGQTPQSAFLDTTRPLALEPARILDLARLVRITARANVEMAATAPVMVDFTHADALNGTIKTVRTGTPVSSLTASLLGNLELEPQLLGSNLLGGLLSRILNTVRALLDPLAPVLDTVVVTVFDVLGLGVGEADLRFLGFDCRNAVLVQ